MRPVVPFCFSDGQCRAGVYCAANACIEQVVQHSEVDVFQAVKTVRRHRPQLISNMVSHRPYKQHKQHNGPPTPTTAHLKHGQSPSVQTTQTTQRSADTDHSSSQTWSVTVRTNNTNNTTVRRHRPQLISNMVSHRPYKQHERLNKMAVLIER